jgi:hypothetical protein
MPERTIDAAQASLLRYCVRRSGLTLSALARKTGVQQSTLHRFCHADARLLEKTAAPLRRYFFGKPAKDGSAVARGVLVLRTCLEQHQTVLDWLNTERRQLAHPRARADVGEITDVLRPAIEGLRSLFARRHPELVGAEEAPGPPRA